MHFNEIRPWADGEVSPHPKAGPGSRVPHASVGTAHRRALKPKRTPHWRMQAVRCEEILGGEVVDLNVVWAQSESSCVVRDYLYPGLACGLGHRGVQRRPAHPACTASCERRLGGLIAIEVTDPDDRPASGIDAELLEMLDRFRHQPLAAGLVDRRCASLKKGDAHAAATGVQRRGQTDRTAADDE